VSDLVLDQIDPSLIKYSRYLCFRAFSYRVRSPGQRPPDRVRSWVKLQSWFQLCSKGKSVTQFSRWNTLVGDHCRGQVHHISYQLLVKTCHASSWLRSAVTGWDVVSDSPSVDSTISSPTHRHIKYKQFSLHGLPSVLSAQ